MITNMLEEENDVRHRELEEGRVVRPWEPEALIEAEPGGTRHRVSIRFMRTPKNC